MISFRVVLVAAVLAAGAAPSCEGESASCTLIGCGAAATIKVDLPLSFAQLQKSTFSLCRNDTCVAGNFSDINAPPSPGTGVGFASVSTLDGGATLVTDGLVLARQTGGFWLEVFWRGNLDEVADGDTYALTVEDENMQKVASLMGTATYDTVYPNGKDCPPGCRHVEFDEHTP